ncbi:MAG: nucleotidyltransferase family protein, partial [Myxococcota bacterium]
MSREVQVAMNVLAARELLARAASTLADARVPMLALKGVVTMALAERLGEPLRRMVDVDVLVPRADRRKAEAALEACGFALRSVAWGATTFSDPESALELDLHVALSDPGLFHIDEDALFERAEPFDALPPHARVPERHDFYAHLVAHFVRNRSDARDRRRVRDFRIVATAWPLEPARLARRLERFGLGRAARFALPVAAAAGDPTA